KLEKVKPMQRHRYEMGHNRKIYKRVGKLVFPKKEKDTRNSSNRRRGLRIMEIAQSSQKINSIFQKKMIDSLLKYLYRKIMIDKVVIVEEEDKFLKLVYKDKEVLEVVKTHFEKQFHKRNSLEDKIPTK
ncbi:19379_t:CDS:2, partial [Gigaspora margarita]